MAWMNRREFLKVAGIGAGLAAWGVAGGAARAADGDDKPNIVVILTDDQGYGDLGCYGAKDIKTPNVDRMAREGVRLTSFYAAPLCSPSRAAFLTGCYPPRVGINRVLFARDKIGLNPREVNIAKLLKGRGYATWCVGKWHLGHRPEFLPTRQGFDGYLGIPYSNDMTLDKEAKLAADAVLREGWTAAKIKSAETLPKNKVPLMRGEEVIEFPVDQSTLTKRYTEEAVKFIEANKERPFFLYFPQTMPHVPLAVSADFKGKSGRGLFGDVIEEIDWSVGQILGAIEKAGLDQKTLVVFYSDNGPWLAQKENGGSAGGLRAGKATTYEGGVRVPCVMRWPGKLPAGKVVGEVAGSIDLLPTLAKVAGAALPAGHVIDGKDIWPMVAEGQKSPHEIYCYYHAGVLEAVRMGKWKLRQAGPKKEVELFDLEADVAETTNLADKEPGIVEKLKKAREAYDKELRAGVRPAGGN